MRTTCLLLLGVALCLATDAAVGAEGRVMKVLPHLLDLEGRQSLSPSLFERDAYQSLLRRNPALVSGMRFDVQWKASKAAVGKLRLRLEVIGSKGTSTKPSVFDLALAPSGAFGTWSAFTLDKDVYKQLGDAAAWRVTLWDGDQLLGEQKSFVW